MIRAGLIRNPRSQRNRARPLVDRGLPPEVEVVAPETPAALAQALQHFAAEGVRHLMVHGGDGTLREVLSLLPAAYGAALPTLAICASGNTNLAALDVGSFRHGEGAAAHWHAVLSGARPGRIARRRPIEVRWPDGSRPPVQGFFVGCANYARGVQMATGAVREKGIVHGWAISATIAGAAWQILSGAEHSDWQQGSRVRLAIDGAITPEARRFLVLATSLDRLLLGLWPFWSPSEVHGPIHWLDIHAPAPRFGRALPWLLRGKPRDWMHDTGAYHSGRARELALTLSEPLIIDGEPFEPDANGELLLCAGPEVQFHAPA